jgi:DNA-binding MarR family transcriptional regulator
MDSQVQREIHDGCFCLALQRAARAVARRYDLALKPIGITSGQFSIMTVVSGPKPLPLTKAARILGQDRTTLTRNIASMERNGLVETTIGDDERVRGLSLTARGQQLLADALPLWRKAQSESTRLAGQGAMRQMRPYLEGLSEESFIAR